jgi:hypothetical protein
MATVILRHLSFANGATGPKGATGLQGIQGPAGVVGEITVQNYDMPLGDGGATSITATCSDPGTKIIGGGAYLNTSPVVSDVPLVRSAPFLSGALPTDGQTFDGWRITFNNPAGGTGATSAQAFAVCAQT